MAKMIISEPSQCDFADFYCKIIPRLYKVKNDNFLEIVKQELKNIRRFELMVEDRVGNSASIRENAQKNIRRRMRMPEDWVENNALLRQNAWKNIRGRMIMAEDWVKNYALIRENAQENIRRRMLMAEDWVEKYEFVRKNARENIRRQMLMAEDWVENYEFMRENARENIMRRMLMAEVEKYTVQLEKELKNMRRKLVALENVEKNVFMQEIALERKRRHTETLTIRCAYMYLHSVLNTNIVYREFSKHMKDNESTFSQHFSSKTLKVCCLGGGPGTEAVGVMKAIHDAIWKLKNENETALVDVYVTVVDECPEWEYEVREIAKTLKNNSDFFPFMKVNFKPAFFRADLLKPFEETLKAIIKESDVVAVVDFVNTLLYDVDYILMNLENMMKNIIESMSEGNCLFMLDSAGEDVFYRTADVIRAYRSAFGPQMLKDEEYTLDAKTINKLQIAANFTTSAEKATFFPARMRKVSSCIWIKKS